MALDPGILFLDEPSAGLDPITSAGLDQTIRGLSRGLGITFVVVTHELQSIYAIADRCIMLDALRKTIIAEGAPADLRDHSEDPYVRQFFLRCRASRRHEQRKAGAMSAKANRFGSGSCCAGPQSWLSPSSFGIWAHSSHVSLRDSSWATSRGFERIRRQAARSPGKVNRSDSEAVRRCPSWCVGVRFEIEEKVSPFPPGSDLEAEIRRAFRISRDRSIGGITGSSILSLKTLT
jgi:ABC-type proline/glycine betaine transport system ATPase subunit